MSVDVVARTAFALPLATWTSYVITISGNGVLEGVVGRNTVTHIVCKKPTWCVGYSPRPYRRPKVYAQLHVLCWIFHLQRFDFPTSCSSNARPRRATQAAAAAGGDPGRSVSLTSRGFATLRRIALAFGRNDGIKNV